MAPLLLLVIDRVSTSFCSYSQQTTANRSFNSYAPVSEWDINLISSFYTTINYRGTSFSVYYKSYPFFVGTQQKITFCSRTGPLNLALYLFSEEIILAARS